MISWVIDTLLAPVLVKITTSAFGYCIWHIHAWFTYLLSCAILLFSFFFIPMALRKEAALFSGKWAYYTVSFILSFLLPNRTGHGFRFRMYHLCSFNPVLFGVYYI